MNSPVIITGEPVVNCCQITGPYPDREMLHSTPVPVPVALYAARVTGAHAAQCPVSIPAPITKYDSPR